MRNLFIIIEGPDNVGKTTLIQNLKNHFNQYTFQTLHFSAVKHSSIEEGIAYSTKQYTEMFELMQHFIKYDKSGIICDRSHLGEMVYGPIYRNYTGEYVLDIEKKYHHIHDLWNNIVLITLYDEPENLIAREDGLSFSADIDKKTTEINNFKHAHDMSTIKNKLLLNIAHHDEQAAKFAVINYIEGLK